MHFELFSRPRTRRDFLRTVPLLAAAAALAEDAPASFSFIAINDLHYFDDDCGRWFRAMVEQMKKEAPGAALCLMCGDLSDRGDRPALDAVKEIFGALDVPFHPVPGNHDYTHDNSREHYDAAYPDRLNYHFTHGGWQFVGLDTTQGTAADKTKIADATLAFLDTAPLDKDLPTVVFTHFPTGEGVSYRPLNTAAMLERLEKLNLVAVLSGHWHGLSERKIPHGEGHQTVLTTSRCSARIRNNMDHSPQKGWWLCQAGPDGTLTRAFHEFQPPAGIPQGPPPAPAKKADPPPPAKTAPAPAETSK